MDGSHVGGVGLMSLVGRAPSEMDWGRRSPFPGGPGAHGLPPAECDGMLRSSSDLHRAGSVSGTQPSPSASPPPPLSGGNFPHARTIGASCGCGQQQPKRPVRGAASVTIITWFFIRELKRCGFDSRLAWKAWSPPASMPSAT